MHVRSRAVDRLSSGTRVIRTQKARAAPMPRRRGASASRYAALRISSSPVARSLARSASDCPRSSPRLVQSRRDTAARAAAATAACMLRRAVRPSASAERGAIGVRCARRRGARYTPFSTLHRRARPSRRAARTPRRPPRSPGRARHLRRAREGRALLDLEAGALRRGLERLPRAPPSDELIAPSGPACPASSAARARGECRPSRCSNVGLPPACSESRRAR